MTDALVVMNKFIEEFQTGGKEAVADELLAPDFVDHTPFPGFGPGRDDVKALFAALRSAFPDLRGEVVEQFTDADRIATRKTFHGTHRGEFFGKPTTGRKVAIRVMDIVRVKDGKLAEHWNVVDVAGLWSQLG